MNKFSSYTQAQLFLQTKKYFILETPEIWQTEAFLKENCLDGYNLTRRIGGKDVEYIIITKGAGEDQLLQLGYHAGILGISEIIYKWGSNENEVDLVKLTKFKETKYLIKFDLYAIPGIGEDFFTVYTDEGPFTLQLTFGESDG